MRSVFLGSSFQYVRIQWKIHASSKGRRMIKSRVVPGFGSESVNMPIAKKVKMKQP